MKIEQTQFLEKVNSDLQKVLSIASPDFGEVNYMLKVYYDQRITCDPTLSAFPGEDVKIDLIVKNLQYMDILTQRVEHLVSIHNRLGDNDPAFKESFFHLHVFQSMTIELDLLRSIGIVNASIDDLKEHFTEVGKILSLSWKYFNNTSKIKLILNTTIAALAEAGGEIKHLPIPALSTSQIQMLNLVYTMESERVVLNWFLKAMPTGTWEDLFHYYESAIHQLETEKTELF